MKSLSIFLVLFATTLAIRINEPKSTNVSATKGETMELSCVGNVDWYTCEFTHESNGKSCKTYWIPENSVNLCKNGIGKMHQKDGSCIIEVKDLKKVDTGSWTCNLTNANSRSNNPLWDTHKFDVEVQDNPPTKTTDGALSTQMSVSILAFTFLIVHI